MKTFEEYQSPAGVIPGPGTDFDMFQNARVVGNTLSSDPNTINGFDTETISDDYFKENDRTKKRKKRNKVGTLSRKIKRFKEFNEGAGFGSTDYRNVTGQATTSGYLNDKQPLGNGGATIAISLPRGNWHEPSTVIVGFKNQDISDPYFIKRKKKKEKEKRETWDRRKRKELAKELNKSELKDKISED